jgi:hypothetical protein
MSVLPLKPLGLSGAVSFLFAVLPCRGVVSQIAADGSAADLCVV